jgi:hypothetical protein
MKGTMYQIGDGEEVTGEDAGAAGFVTSFGVLAFGAVTFGELTLGTLGMAR